MGLAQTGTGKTAAFVLPLLHRLMTGPNRRLRALIVAPTRELADQIREAMGELGRHTGLRTATLYGGVNKSSQVKKLREGMDVVVACPGRLLDLMDQGEVDVSSVEMLVLDEADRMFDMGFLPEIRKIVRRLPEKRQTLLFSATMPEEIQRLTREVMHEPRIVRIDDNLPVPTVSHSVYPVESHLKTALLVRLLNNTETRSVLVFTRTRHRATRLASQIHKAGFAVASLQGDLPQNKRQEALRGFREGRYPILVATDIVARGIDVSSISHVINYDMPDTVDAYIHRIGRTGRATKTGDAFSFVTGEERSFVWAVEKALGESLERRVLADFNYASPVTTVGLGDGGMRDERKGRQGRGPGSEPAGRRSGLGRQGRSLSDAGAPKASPRRFALRDR
jgi:ATP-dependent RNA helicase RhlE